VEIGRKFIFLGMMLLVMSLFFALLVGDGYLMTISGYEMYDLVTKGEIATEEVQLKIGFLIAQMMIYIAAAIRFSNAIIDVVLRWNDD